MKCIYCGSKTQVTNSRPLKKLPGVWRRRECTECKAIYTTQETPDLEKNLAVSSASKYHPFQRDKLFASILNACGHRKAPVSTASALTDTVITKLLPIAEQGLLTTTQIVKTTIKVLENFDNAACVQYRAYHASVAKS